MVVIPLPPLRWGMLWSRISHAAWALLAIQAWTAVLVVSLCTCARAEDVPRWVLAGIAAVETTSTWHGPGSITYRDKRLGAAGEVGPWQLSPAVLTDLGVLKQAGQIHRNVALAERHTRAWLRRLYDATGSWPAAIASYHAGSGNRRKQYAITYADRVDAIGKAEVDRTSPADAAR